MINRLVKECRIATLLLVLLTAITTACKSQVTFTEYQCPTADSAPEEPNLLLVRINYRIRANNALGNLVYPFYIGEGA